MPVKRLNQRVLVLNRLWQAVNIIGVKRAFSLLMMEHAQAIHTGPDAIKVLDAEGWIAHSIANPPTDDRDCIHTVRLRLRLPSVILLRYYDRVGAAARAAQFGPRDPTQLRRPDHLGEHRLLLHQVQYAQGQPPAPPSGHAFN